jgi:hypothetical protein
MKSKGRSGWAPVVMKYGEHPKRLLMETRSAQNTEYATGLQCFWSPSVALYKTGPDIIMGLLNDAVGSMVIAADANMSDLVPLHQIIKGCNERSSVIHNDFSK